MYKIDTGLWQGGAPNQALPEEITAIVNLSTACVVDYGMLSNNIVCIIGLPIADGPFPGLAWLKNAVALMEQLRKANHVLYVHCRVGISRSAMLIAAYLMKGYGHTINMALETIAEKNSSINPSPSFMDGLREWRDYLKGEGLQHY